MLALAAQVYRQTNRRRRLRAARRLFGFSIVYLFALFAALLLGELAARLPSAL
ncbi:MAG: hypothetical protein MZV49_14460 [Rhodopseudomonas palustris]|nr:hypothetical protein [Rhodopseudomonas palustris]